MRGDGRAVGLRLGRRGERRAGRRGDGPRHREPGGRCRRRDCRPGRDRRSRQPHDEATPSKPAGRDRENGRQSCRRRSEAVEGEEHAAARKRRRRSARHACVRVGARAVQGIRVLGEGRRQGRLALRECVPARHALEVGVGGTGRRSVGEFAVAVRGAARHARRPWRSARRGWLYQAPRQHQDSTSSRLKISVWSLYEKISPYRPQSITASSVSSAAPSDRKSSSSCSKRTRGAR
ncbi:hypothetical protein BCPG_02339 [Burkholderia cenocepacia PC184]|nr:hypothetical protein BCPG_02339 [Burkholderia cenocepacia PC184]